MNISNLSIEIFSLNDISYGTIDGSRIISDSLAGYSELNAIGNGEFMIALDDTESLDLLARNRIALCTYDSLTDTDLIFFCIIIRDIKQEFLPNGRAVLRISGPDMLRELTYNNLGYTVFDDGSGGELTSLINTMISTYAPSYGAGWTSTGFDAVSATQDDGYAVAAGENLWQAITQIGPTQNTYFALGLKHSSYSGIPCRSLIQWRQFLRTSHGTSGAPNFDAWTIVKSDVIDGTFRIIEDTPDAVTRAIVFGAGTGTDRFTIADKTDSDPTGFSSTPADSLIVNTALEAETDQPEITRVIHYHSIKPEDPDDAAMTETAANELFQAGITYLKENDGSTRKFYEIEAIPEGNHVPGQLVTFTFSRVSPYDAAGAENDTTIVNINDTFVLLKYSRRIDANGNIIARILIGDSPTPPTTGAEMTARKIEQLEEVTRHSTSAPGTSSPGSGTGPYLHADGSVDLIGNLDVSAGIEIDGVDLSAFNGANFIMTSGSTETANERILTAGDGLTSADSGPGANFTIDLGTPGDVDTSSTSAATASSHTHAIDNSSNPGAAARILSTTASGYIQLTGLGIGRAADANELQTAVDLALYSGAGISADAALEIATTAGSLTLAPAGDIILDPAGEDILPPNNYEKNIGTDSLKFLSIAAAELKVTNLVSENVIATINGRVIVGNSTEFTRDAAAGDTTIYVKHNEMISGDRAYAESGGSVEFFAITSGPTLQGAGDYSYSVTRNLDGTGANDWAAGDGLANTGQAGDGFIDMYSSGGIVAGSGTGPTIAGMVRQSSTYNDIAPNWAIGDLDNLYGYTSTTYGAAFGTYKTGANHITIDDTNGVRIRAGTGTTIGSWAVNADLRLGEVATNKANLFWDNSTGRLNFRGGASGTATQAYIDTDGSFLIGGGDVTLGNNGITIEEGGASTPDITWTDGGIQFTQLTSYRDGSGTTRFFVDASGDAGDPAAELNIVARSNAGTGGTLIGVREENTAGTAAVLGGGGLYIGAGGTYPAAAVMPSGGDLKFEGELISRKSSTDYTGYIYVPLSTPLEATAWQGGSRSTVSTSTGYLASNFSVPSAAKAIAVDVRVNDSGSWGGGAYYWAAGPTTTYWYQLVSYCYGGDLGARQFGIINLDSSGRFYWQTNASGTNTLDVYIRVWGYFI